MNEYGRPPSRGLWAIFASLFRGVDLARRIVLNLIFLLLLILLIAVTADETVIVPEKTALLVAPQGPIVEQLSGDARDRAVDRALGNEEYEVLLRDLTTAIKEAESDDRIAALVLKLDFLGATSITKLQAVAKSIKSFKESGKPVYAIGDVYGKDAYYLAAHADKIYLHEMGMVLLEGYSRYRTFYKEGIDRLEVDWNVFRVGEYKSAVEPYLRMEMSDEAREANLEWLGDLWNSWLEDVAAARGMQPEALQAIIENFPTTLEENDGDAAQTALALGLVDEVGWRDAYRTALVEIAGEDEESGSFQQILHENYLIGIGKGDSAGEITPPTDAVGVLVARGTILDGSHPPGAIGGDSTAALIRDARLDDGVKAIVLRVDSGGGSAFASEVIRRELALTREAGKPVVVSMGSYAASGGYWIAVSSDEIWAEADTVTGSIGIFSMFPTFQKPLRKHLGMNVDGVGTTSLAGALRPDRALDPEVGEVIQQLTEQGYRDFLERVAEAREMDTAQVDEIARGRVWSGADAYEIGLVDQLGDLDDAVAAAAALAELGEDPNVRYLEPEVDFQDQWMIDLLGFATDRLSLGRVAQAASPPTLFAGWSDFLEEQSKHLASLNDPRGIYAHCLCSVD